MSRRAAALALAALTLLPAFGAPAAADHVPEPILPAPTDGMAVAWTGTHAFLFGGGLCGTCAPTDRIVRYTPSTGEVVEMQARLPTPRGGASAVWTGTHAFVFGGTDGGDEVLRYDPATDTLVVTSTVLTPARWATTAFWDGVHAYVVGGATGTVDAFAAVPSYQMLGSVDRFDPATGLVTAAGVWSGSPFYGSASVWTGTEAYIFGGQGCLSTSCWASSQVVRYRPGETDPFDKVADIEGRLFASAAWDGRYAYVAGGWTRAKFLDYVHRFDPTTARTDASGATLPGPRAGGAAVWDGERLRYVGGTDGTGAVDRVSTHETLPANAPSGFAAAASGGRNVTLSWSPPPGPGGSPVTGYRIWRGTSATDLAHLADVGDVRTLTDGANPHAATIHYKIAALNGAGEGPASPVASATTEPGPAEPPTNLVAPRGPELDQISLAWDPPVFDGGHAVEAYRLTRQTGVDPPVLLGETTSSSRTWVDSGLVRGTTYTYHVRALTAAGEGAAATIAQTPPNVPGPPVVSFTPLENAVQVSWTLPDDGGRPVSAYNIYKGDTEDTITFVDRVPSTTTSWTDGGLQPGHGRWYRVSAMNDIGEGPPSYPQFGTALPGAPLTAPGNLTAEGGAYVVRLRWEYPADDGGAPVGGYNVYRGGTSYYDKIATTSEPYYNASANEGSSWWYYVSAWNSEGEGPKAAVVGTAWSRPSAPQAPAAAPGAALGEVALSWDPPADFGGDSAVTYRVVRVGLHGVLETVANGLTSPSFVDTGRANASETWYRVLARNSVGEGPWTADLLGTSPPGGPSVPNLVAATRGPEDGGSTGEITVTWRPPRWDGGAPVTAYRVWRDGALVAEVGPVLAWQDKGLPKTTTPLAYRVSAVNAHGEGPRSHASTASVGDLRTLDFHFVGTNHSFALESDTRGAWIDVRDGYVRITDAQKDAGEERLVRSLGPRWTSETATFEVTARWWDEGRFAGGAANPLFLAAGDVEDVGEDPNSIQFLAYSEGYYNRPIYYLRYRDASGVLRIDHAHVGYHDVTYDVQATYDRSTRLLTMRLWDGIYLRAEASYRVGTHPGDGFVVEKIGMGTDDAGLWYGYGGGDGAVRDVRATYELAPDVPASVEVAGADGTATVSWQPPALDSSAPVSAWRVWRRSGADAETLVAELAADARALTEGGLAVKVPHDYRVAAVSAEGEGARSLPVTIQFPGPPEPPASVVALRDNATGAALVAWEAPAWDGGAPVTAYRVWRGYDGAETLLAETTATSLTDAAVDIARDASYRVAAVNAEGEGASTAAALPAVQTPSSPTSLSALGAAADGTASLAWGAPESDGGMDVTLWRVYRGATPEAAALVAETTLPRYDDSGLAAGDEVHYLVAGVNARGEGDAAAARLLWDLPPAAPASLSAEPGPGKGQVTLAWQPPPDTGVLATSHYVVYRAPVGGAETVAATTTGPGLVESGLDPGTTYAWRVAAVNAAGEGAAAGPVEATPPVAPPDLSLTFDASDEGFVREADAPNSEIRWDALNRRVYLRADRRDAIDEVYARQLQGTATDLDSAFTASVRWRLTGQGAHQVAYPLALAGADATDVETAPGTAYVRFETGAGGGPATVRLRYRDDAGILRIDHAYSGSATVEYRFVADYDLQARRLTLAVQDAWRRDLATASRVLADGEGFAFEKVAFATDGAAAGASTAAIGWADDVRVDHQQAPLAPPGLTAAPGPEAGAIRLAWSTPKGGLAPVERYEVWRRPATGGAPEKVAETPETSWADTGLPAGSSWRYTVRAVNAWGAGEASAEVSATAPVPPGPPRAVEASPGPHAGGATLRWAPPAGDGGSPVAAYRVWRASNFGPLVLHATVGAVTEFRDENLSAGVVYTYAVTAVNAVGEGPQSARASTVAAPVALPASEEDAEGAK